jgi:hypothetical protein
MPRHLVDQNYEHRDCGPDRQAGDDCIEDDGRHLEESTTEVMAEELRACSSAQAARRAAEAARKKRWRGSRQL